MINRIVEYAIKNGSISQKDIMDNKKITVTHTFELQERPIGNVRLNLSHEGSIYLYLNSLLLGVFQRHGITKPRTMQPPKTDDKSF